jgi:hypothetical protein
MGSLFAVVVAEALVRVEGYWSGDEKQRKVRMER